MQVPSESNNMPPMVAENNNDETLVAAMTRSSNDDAQAANNFNPRFLSQQQRPPSKRLCHGSALYSSQTNNNENDLLALSFNHVMKKKPSQYDLGTSSSLLFPTTEEIIPEEVIHNNHNKKRHDVEHGNNKDTTTATPTTTKSGLDWRIIATDAFHAMDQNKDGYLQRNEVFLAIARMKLNQQLEYQPFVSDPARFVDGLLEQVDTDGDGQINYKEYMTMMKTGLFFHDEENEENDDSSNSNNNNNNKLHKITQFARNVFLSHQERIENNTIGDDVWLIHPLGKLHALWDIMISLLVMCVLIVTLPLSLGWDELNSKFLILITVFDFLFVLDMLKNFVTGYIDENDVIVLDRKAVARHYLCGYFVADLLGSFPYDFVLYIAGVMSDRGFLLGAKHSMKALKLFRFFKFFRFARASKLVQTVNSTYEWWEERLNIHPSHGLSKLCGLFLLALVLAHWMGCINFMLVRLYDFPKDSWVVAANLQDLSIYSQWNWSFFKGLAFFILVGFQVSPFTNSSCETTSEWCKIEHWTTLICLLLGGLFQTVIVAWMISIHQTTNLASRSFEEKLNQLDGYMKAKKLPASIREKALDHFHQLYPNQKYFDYDLVQNRLLSPLHLREMKYLLAKDIIEKVPLLSSPENKDFSRELATLLEPVIVFAGELIFQEQTSGDRMYFISSGLVELFFSDASTKEDDAYLVIGDGCYFGEVSLLVGIKRTTCARAKTQCLLYQVKKQDLLSILDDFPQVSARMSRVAMNRTKRVQQVTNPILQQEQLDEELDSEDINTELFGSQMASKDRQTRDCLLVFE